MRENINEKEIDSMKKMIGKNLGKIGTVLTVATAVLGVIEGVVDKKQQDRIIKETVKYEVQKALSKKR